MSMQAPSRRETARRGAPGNGHPYAVDEVPTRVFLQPIAALSVLGLYGFAAATFIVAANPIEYEWAEPGVRMGQ